MSSDSKKLPEALEVEGTEEKVVEIFPVPELPEDLLRQLIAHYPEEDFPTLRKVISLGKVKYVDKELMPGMPMTAAVMNTRPPTLVFGKEFLETTTKTTEDRVYLLSHELTHLVLDHFAADIIEEFEKARKVVREVKEGEEVITEEEYEALTGKAVNIILDCQVNATVVNSLHDPKYHQFVKDYYPEDKMPYCFFRPDGKPELDEYVIKNNLQDEMSDLHRQLYSADGVTNRKLIDSFLPWFEDQQDQLSEVMKKLLGNHKDIMSDRGGSGSNSEEMSDLADAMASDLADYIKGKKSEEEGQSANGKDGEGESEDGQEKPGGKKAGKGGPIRERMLKKFSEDLQTSRNIKSRLKTKLVVSPVSRIFQAIDFYVPRRSVRSVVPNFNDRRTASMYSKGKMPVFHKRAEIGSKVMIPCYLDVSGSQEHVLDDTSLAVSRLRQELGNVVYCFSTHIHEAKITSLKNRDSIQTSGGTCFNVVAEHILKNGYKCAVILTDGEAYMRPELQERLLQRGVHITVGWTTANPSKSPLEKIAKKTFYVFDKNSGHDDF